MKKKIISLLTLTAMLLSLMMPAFAANTGTFYKISDENKITISESGSYLVYGSTTTSNIVIKDNAVVDLTIYDMTINNPAIRNINMIPGIYINSGSTLNLTLIGENYISGGYGQAGILVPADATLNITEDSTGSLTAIGNSGGAGIGTEFLSSEYNPLHAQQFGCVNIKGGTIKAVGNSYSAGIGGTYGSSGGSISITGGDITAIGGAAAFGSGTSPHGMEGYAAAGIGGGSFGMIDNISISGGKVRAFGGGAQFTNYRGTIKVSGAGIGAGNDARDYRKTSYPYSIGNISITGGSVYAEAGCDNMASAIGTGNNSNTTDDLTASEGSITISDAFVDIGSGKLLKSNAGTARLYTAELQIADLSLTKESYPFTFNIESGANSIDFTKNINVTNGYARTMQNIYAAKSLLGSNASINVTNDDGLSISSQMRYSDNVICYLGNAYTFSITINDGRLTEGDFKADIELTSNGKTTQINDVDFSVQNYTATASIDFCAVDQISGDSSILITAQNSNTWSKDMLLSNQHVFDINFGSKLYPVSLMLFSDKITSDVPITSLKFKSYRELNDGTNGPAEYFAPNKISCTEPGKGILVAYLPADALITTTIVAEGLFDGEAFTAKAFTVNAEQNNVFTLYNQYGLEIPESFDISKGSVLFEKDTTTGTLIVSYYNQSGVAVKASGLDINEEYTVTQSSSDSTTNGIIVKNIGADDTLKLKLSNLNIVTRSDCIDINNSKVALNIADSNSVISNSLKAAISVDASSYAIIDGDGTLNAQASSGGAAIGSDGAEEYSGKLQSGGTIEINGGNIATTSTSVGGTTSNKGCGASIGSGDRSTCTVIINGGTLTVTSTYSGAGIGSGVNGEANVTINGGNIWIFSIFGSGIGAGSLEKSKCTITINGGYIKFTRCDNNELGKSPAGQATTVINGGVFAFSHKKIDPVPVNGEGKPVYITTLNLANVYSDKKIINAFIRNSNYNLNGGVISQDLVSLMLPQSDTTLANFNGAQYSGAVTTDNNSVLTRNALTLSVDVKKTSGTSTEVTYNKEPGATLYYVQSATQPATAEAIINNANVKTADGSAGTLDISDLKEKTTYTYYFVYEYNNTYTDIKKITFTTTCDHNYINGVCSKCNEYQPAEQNEQDNYYEVGNAGQLMWIASGVNDGSLRFSKIRLVDDIDLKGFDWTPMGIYDEFNIGKDAFAGIFDGGRYKISNINSMLFACVANGLVTNVVIESDDYPADISGLYPSFGSIIGVMAGATLSNSYSKAAIDNVDSGYRFDNVGGLVGIASGTINNCGFSGDFSAIGTNVGGLVGGTLSNSTFTLKNSCVCFDNYSNTVMDSSTNYGMLIGYTDITAAIDNCYEMADNAEDVPEVGFDKQANSSYLDTSMKKTSDEMKSGDIAFKLQNSQDGFIWGQYVGSEYPIISNDLLRKVYLSENDEYFNKTGVASFNPSTRKLLISANDNYSAAAVIVAAYSDNKLLFSEYSEKALSNEHLNEINLINKFNALGIDNVKIMVWDKISSMKPLCSKKIIPAVDLNGDYSYVNETEIVSFDSSTGKLFISADDNYSAAAVTVAAYSSDKLLFSEYSEKALSNEHLNEFDMTSDFDAPEVDTVKIMVWDKISSMKPLCDKKSVPTVE